MTHGFDDRCHPRRRSRFLVPDIDQEGSAVSDDDEVELVLIVAIPEDRRRGTPLGDLGIEIEQASEITSVLGSEQRRADALDSGFGMGNCR